MIVVETRTQDMGYCEKEDVHAVIMYVSRDSPLPYA